MPEVGREGRRVEKESDVSLDSQHRCFFIVQSGRSLATTIYSPPKNYLPMKVWIISTPWIVDVTFQTYFRQNQPLEGWRLSMGGRGITSIWESIFWASITIVFFLCIYIHFVNWTTEFCGQFLVGTFPLLGGSSELVSDLRTMGVRKSPRKLGYRTPSKWPKSGGANHVSLHPGSPSSQLRFRPGPSGVMGHQRPVKPPCRPLKGSNWITKRWSRGVEVRKGWDFLYPHGILWGVVYLPNIYII